MRSFGYFHLFILVFIHSKIKLIFEFYLIIDYWPRLDWSIRYSLHFQSLCLLSVCLLTPDKVFCSIWITFICFQWFHLSSFHFLPLNSSQVSDFHIWTATLKKRSSSLQTLTTSSVQTLQLISSFSLYTWAGTNVFQELHFSAWTSTSILFGADTLTYTSTSFSISILTAVFQ